MRQLRISLSLLTTTLLVLAVCFCKRLGRIRAIRVQRSVNRSRLGLFDRMSQPTQKKYLVIGGCGFLGRWVAEVLCGRGEKNVHVMDIRKTFDDPRMAFVEGNICDAPTLAAALKGYQVVIHTASPTAGNRKDLMYKVNVEGTNNVIAACITNRVEQLVFTSSASIVFEGKDLKFADEDAPICKTFIDYYSESKAIAEKAVLAANGKSGLLTVSIRPSAIFGPRDVQAWPEIIKAAKQGKSKYQIGNGNNLTDYTYVENVALAHVLASDKLCVAGSPIAGKAYFITNDEPIPFWDMPKYVYRSFGYPEPSIKIPYFLMYYLAVIVDLFAWLVSPVVTLTPTFTFLRVSIAGSHRTYNISRAKRELGYVPRVTLQDGMKRAFEYFKKQEEESASKKLA